MIFCRWLAVLSALAAMASPASADAQNGKSLAKQRCQTCHGIDGIALIPNAPHLAGESQIYLEMQLEAFRDGRRTHEIMSVIAKDLTDEQISDVAQWFSSIEIIATLPD